MPMPIETCALAFGTNAKNASSAMLQSRVFSPRMDDPFKCLRFVELHGVLLMSMLVRSS
jgi:hypothetical protein